MESQWKELGELGPVLKFGKLFGFEYEGSVTFVFLAGSRERN
jgi:hypothetical protein